MPRNPPAHNALLNGVLLHGRLEVTVERADQLWEPGARSARERVVRALASGSTINPYVTVRLEQLPRYKRLLKTEAIAGSDAPVWNYHASIDVASVASFVVVHVKTSAKNDQSGIIYPHKSLGFVRLRAQDVMLNVVDGWYTLAGHQGLGQPGQYAPPGAVLGPVGVDRKNRGKIKLKIQYWPVEVVLTAVSDRMPTVPGTYFRATEGCHVNLFQDAHCPKHAVLELPGSSDAIYDSPSKDKEVVMAEGNVPCSQGHHNIGESPVTLAPGDEIDGTMRTQERLENAAVRFSQSPSSSQHQQPLDAEQLGSPPCPEPGISQSSLLSSCGSDSAKSTRNEVEVKVVAEKVDREGNESSSEGRQGTMNGDGSGDDFDLDVEMPGISHQISAAVDNTPTEEKSPFPRASNYFEEIYRAIFHARKLVYITGWSVDTTMKLLRQTPERPIALLGEESAVPDVTAATKPGEDDGINKRFSAGHLQQLQETRLAEAAAATDLISDPLAMAGLLPLGELLKRKADAGVRVLLLVWDEVFSTNRPLLRWMSLMDTKDEVTREFFRKTRVRAAVVPRIGRAGRKAAILTSPIVPCMFTFHEKLIITDVPLKTGHHLSRQEELALKAEKQKTGEESAAAPDSLRHILRSRFPNLPARPHLPHLEKANLPHLPNLDKLRDLPANIPGRRSHTHNHGHPPTYGDPSTAHRSSRGRKVSFGNPGSSSASNSLSVSELGAALREAGGNQRSYVERGKINGEGFQRPPRKPGPLRLLLSNRRLVTPSSDASLEGSFEGGMTGSSSADLASAESPIVQPPAPFIASASSDVTPNFTPSTSEENRLKAVESLGNGVHTRRATSFGGDLISPTRKDALSGEVGNDGADHIPVLPFEAIEDPGPSNKQYSQSFHMGESAAAAPSSGIPAPGRPRGISTLSPRLQNARQHIAAHQLNIPNLPTPRASPTPAAVAGQPRQLTAFIGGLDMTYGRFDSPDHSIFRTLDTAHKEDFHNACFDVASPVGPREPWHDVAANVTGPVVRDFVASFEERWRRQGRGVAHLVDWANDKEIHDGPFAYDEEQWSVQVFRSIDERSAVFRRGEERLLETKKGRQVDRSIHHAYVHYTRTARRFIYIEQQYFIGSSNQWLSYNHGDATNLVPYEIALRIAASIREGRPLRVYVVIPMWPEGFADDITIQKILFFQFKTVEMMYCMVADAIVEVGLVDAHPTDYLNFFCLGNREIQGAPDGGGVSGEGQVGCSAHPGAPSSPSCPVGGSSNFPDVASSGIAFTPPGSPQPPSARGSPSGSEAAADRPDRGTAVWSALQTYELDNGIDRRTTSSRWRWIPRGAPSRSGSSSVFSSRFLRFGKRRAAGSETSSVPSSILPPSVGNLSVDRSESGLDAKTSSSSQNATAAVDPGSDNPATDRKVPWPTVSKKSTPYQRVSGTDCRVPRSESQTESVASMRSQSTFGGVPSPVQQSKREISGLSFVPSLSLSRSESKQRTRKPRRGDEDALSKSRRHPIYQHAKLFIRDDEVAVCGSANLNERSMAGVRDTEMAIGTFQPKHTYAHLKAERDAKAKSSGYDLDADRNDDSLELPLPRGEVSRFRKRLWAEHALGPGAEAFPTELEDPGSLETVRAMREIGKRNWEAYSGEDVVEMHSHLILYPYEVSKSGEVTGAVRFFPDTKGPICGTPNDVIPNILTS